MIAPDKSIPHLSIYYPEQGIIVCPDRSIIPYKRQASKKKTDYNKIENVSELEGAETCNCEYTWNYSTNQYDITSTDCNDAICCEEDKPTEYVGDVVTSIVDDCIVSGTGTGTGDQCDMCVICRRSVNKPGPLVCEKGKPKLANDYPAMGGPWAVAYNATGRVWVNLGGL